ncbi:MAG: hypothetical protein ABI045_06970 [Flavobacteriales bacterium]
MPRKFRITIVIPSNNDVDVLINHIGLIAIIEDHQLKIFDVAFGNGLFSTHDNPATYARLDTVLGFVEAREKALSRWSTKS